MSIISKVVPVWLALNLFAAVTSLTSMMIHAPAALITGSDAELSCTYDLGGTPLYSIRWYHNSSEFYRYVPKESPPTRVFPVSEIKVDVASSDEHRVSLRRVDRVMTGQYHCEVSADAPLFQTEIESAFIVIVDPPLASPNVTSNRMSYVGGDHIRVNCTSPPSLPAANITWYVNEQMVPGLTANHVLNFSNGFASSQATLELEAAELSPSPTLIIRCEAWIFDVWKGSSETLVLRERSANPASALGSLTGAANERRLSTLIVVFVQILFQPLLCSFSEAAKR